MFLYLHTRMYFCTWRDTTEPIQCDSLRQRVDGNRDKIRLLTYFKKK